jgi:hypothetical protein
MGIDIEFRAAGADRQVFVRLHVEAVFRVGLDCEIRFAGELYRPRVARKTLRIDERRAGVEPYFGAVGQDDFTDFTVCHCDGNLFDGRRGRPVFEEFHIQPASHQQRDEKDSDRVPQKE